MSDEEWKEELKKELGNLFKAQFYRVVLDEAHVMKNRNSRSE